MTEQAMVKRQTTVRRMYRRILFGSFLAKEQDITRRLMGWVDDFLVFSSKLALPWTAIRFVRPRVAGEKGLRQCPMTLAATLNCLSCCDIDVR
jgi:hypothetical protein